MEKIFSTSSCFTTLQTYVSLTPEHYNLISNCARDLDLSFDSVLMAVVNTAVRRHFEQCSVSSDQEVSS